MLRRVQGFIRLIDDIVAQLITHGYLDTTIFLNNAWYIRMYDAVNAITEVLHSLLSLRWLTVTR